MVELMAQYLNLILLGGIVAFVALMMMIAKKPVKGLYLVFFASAILMTLKLPIVREKFTSAECLILMTWVAMLFTNRRVQEVRCRLLPTQKKTILVGWGLILWIVLSFLINNLEDFDKVHIFLWSAVESLNYFYGFMIFLTVIALVDTQKRWYGCLHAWIWGGVVVSLVGTWAMLGNAPSWAYEEFTGRVSSTLRNENQVPSYLMPILVPLVFMTVRNSTKNWLRILLITLVCGILLTVAGTGSRTSILMLFGCFVGIFCLGRTAWNKKVINRYLLSKMALGLCGVSIVYVLVAITSYDGHYSLGKTPSWQRPVVLIYDWIQGNRALDEVRARQMTKVKNAIMDSPFWGAGPKLFGTKYKSHEIHNTYAAVLMDLGLPGLILFLLWLLACFSAGLRSARYCSDPFLRLMILSACVGMVVLLLYSMTIYGLRQRNIWLMAGLLAAAPRVVLREQQEAHRLRATQIPQPSVSQT